MKNLLQPTDRDNLISRLDQLRPESRGRWGKMSAEQIVAHLTDPLKVAIGDRQAAAMNSVFSRWPVKQCVVWWMPWPKGAPTADEFIQGKKGTPPTDFDQDKQQLLLYIHRFAHFSGSYAPSPVFGPLTNRAWGRLMWRHIDHHLRQFGL